MKNWKNWIIALIITTLAVPVMHLLVINPFENKADFSMSDFYIRTANRTKATTISNDIVILAVDNLSRLEIAQVAEKADFFGAKSVALDVFMNWETENDNEVIISLSSCDNLILPSSLTDRVNSPVYEKIQNAKYGYTNLECKWEGAKIRTFSTETSNIISFAAAACNNKNPTKGIIRYDCRDFDVINPENINPQTVQGKIVFIGNLNDFSDCHPTPIGVFPGVMIHAFIARTIIESNSPRPLPKVLDIILSLIIVFLIAFIHSFFNKIDGDLANFVLRILQLILLFIFYFTGSLLFIKYNIYANLSLLTLLIAAMLLVFDFAFGINYLLQLCNANKNSQKKDCQEKEKPDMKKITLLLLLILSLDSYAGNTYTIFRIKGDIKRRALSSEIWETASRRDTVKLSDSIIIPDGGEISILASETGIIYTSNTIGQIDVKHIIDNSKESLNSTLGAVVNELGAEIKTKNESSLTNRVHGATSRGKNSKNQKEIKLAKRILKGNKRINLDFVEENDCCKFRINSRTTCNICILCTNNGSSSLCLPSGGVKVHKGETVFQQPEVVPSKGATYYIFKVKEPFDESELCRHFTDLISN